MTAHYVSSLPGVLAGTSLSPCNQPSITSFCVCVWARPPNSACVISFAGPLSFPLPEGRGAPERFAFSTTPLPRHIPRGYTNLPTAPAQDNFCRSPRMRQCKCSCSKSWGDVNVKVYFCQWKNCIAKEYTDTCFFLKLFVFLSPTKWKNDGCDSACPDRTHLRCSLLRHAKSVKAL